MNRPKRPSPKCVFRLQETEAEIERLRRAPRPASVESLLPQLPVLIRKHVATIERFARHDPARARAAVRQALEADSIVLRPAEHGRHVVAEFGLVLVAVATGTSSENVVAGARFGNYLPPSPVRSDAGRSSARD
jgi:hypothetical protein